MTRVEDETPVLSPAQGDRYPVTFNPVTEPRGRARVRWGDLLAGLDGPGGLGGLGGFELTGDPDVEVDAITHDSRLAGRGACFACIRGAVTDGHDHAPEAVERGAVALLVERPIPLPVPQARVRSVRAALGPLAATLHGHPSAAMRVLGVTGTNGKTTTAYLLEAVARAAGERVGVIGTVGARVAGETVATAHTTPEASDLQALLARMRDAAVATVAMEVSSHALEQHRVDGVQFTAVCFTNLSHEHLDYHGTLDAYFEAKARLFDPRRTRAAAVNLDDPRGVELVARLRGTDLDLWTYAVDDDTADVTAEAPSFAADATTCTFVDRRSDDRVAVRLPLVGPFNLANALAAATTARAAGFALATVADGLAQPLVVPGRFERVDAGQPFTVLVDYAHTPDALGRVLAAARPLTGPGGRVVCVFGCGGDRDPAKRPLMGAAVAAAADLAVLTSDNPRSEEPQAIADAVLPGLRTGPALAAVELDRRVAIATALGAAGPGDVVVIAGKGHETGQTAHDRTVPFDDRVVAREELGALGWN
jgi:UDP-N-acetylmuramoyl-L-alanyl-D-glutamate--2,6-diaminopimelate ligase